MTKTHYNTEGFNLAVSWSVLLGASGIWAYNTLLFFNGLVG